jgi:hypothetical protein
VAIGLRRRIGIFDNIPINKNKPIGNAIMMPKAVLTVLSLKDPIKTMIDISARHHQVSEFSATACLSRSLSDQGTNTAGYVCRNSLWDHSSSSQNRMKTSETIWLASNI